MSSALSIFFLSYSYSCSVAFLPLWPPRSREDGQSELKLQQCSPHFLKACVKHLPNHHNPSPESDLSLWNGSHMGCLADILD